ncbi:MAG: beta-galactosidase [Anaerolineae bacterium]|nr:beta-galactosidase [Anaerolineae bacterium]
MTDQPPKANNTPPARLHLGAAYYPEHWPAERWPEDVRLMQEAGFTVVRMAEFAWSTLEPTASEFNFDWLDRAITMFADAGMVSVLGTPTAAPPAWLIQQHPDILPFDEKGRQVQFGNRTHFCVNSLEFHAAVQRIVTAMGEHFGPNRHVIGWQVDNEYSRVCYCDRCQRRFQEYLQEKFESLDALNERWSTRYWSQTYTDWAQIPLPIGLHNPGLRLAFKQFVTESYRRYQKLQLDALRPHLPPGVWVTHNFMNWFDAFDHYALTEDLDLASWDWYVGTGHLDYLAAGAAHDLVRGFKQKNFWLIETQPNHVNWRPVNNTLNKGEGRVMAWHAVAHGAEAVLYWQWRSALGGQEQYHGTLIDPSGQPRPFYSEVQRLGREFAKVSHLLAGATTDARVAILNDYNSRWSIQAQPHHQDFDYVAHLVHYYKPLAALNIPVDIISADVQDLSRYRLVFAPALMLINQRRAEVLTEYVEYGGRLVLTARTGMKDDDNALWPMRQPGLLAELAGVEVEEYFALDEPVPVKGNWFEGYSHQWAELLNLTDKLGAAIAHYGPANGWLDDQLAITVRSHKSGLVYYVGTYLDEAAQYALLERFTQTVKLSRPRITAPQGVEIRTLVNPDKTEIWLAINHQRTGKIVESPWPVLEHLSGKTFEGKFKLAPYGVAVLTRPD